MTIETLHQNGVFGISHVDIPVTNLERAAQFYLAGLGFVTRQCGVGWVDLDASAVLVRLIEAPSADRRTSLRVQVASLEPVYQALLSAGGRKLYEPTRTDDQELIASARDLDGNTITVWRPLSEDEYGFLPNLPVETEWSPQAQVLLKSLLLAVPALFRPLARRKVVRLAEELCPHAVIAERDVVRAYIMASAKITRYRLRDPLMRHGFHPNDYQLEFESE